VQLVGSAERTLFFLAEVRLTSSGKDIWNARYQDAGDDYLFGTEPNRYLASRASLFERGSKALAVADGEGRHSVWLAEHGVEVTAVEISPVAVDKAQRLAASRNVAMEFAIADMLSVDWPPESYVNAFDWVIGIFIQFVGAAEREMQFSALKRATRPGGHILLQGYTPKQLEYRTGGPPDIANLYTRELLQEAFSDWSIEELVEYEEDISEGARHKGRSALIGFIARKPT
jgi:cyclopropane fatty-acyl-phospholipid synthase-like methyltransferase